MTVDATTGTGPRDGGGRATAANACGLVCTNMMGHCRAQSLAPSTWKRPRTQALAALLVLRAAAAYVCRDSDPVLCPSWTRGGECIKNPAYMLKNCQLSCGVCGFQCAAQTQWGVLCKCNAGYSGPIGGPCVGCEAGKFKSTNGTKQCDECAAGTVSQSAGSTHCQNCSANTFSSSSRSACLSCPANSFSAMLSANATDCQCNRGFSGPNGKACAACTRGTYKNAVGPSPCQPCARGTYSSNLSAWACMACPSNSTSPAGSPGLESCVCTAGYQGDNATVCRACPTAKYKDSIANAACLPCPPNTFAEQGKASITDCRCDPGYSGPDGGLCTACEAGKYKGFLGAGGCDACEAGKFKAHTGPGPCTACPPNSEALPGSEFQGNCKCNTGHTGPNGGQCNACGLSTWKNSTGSAGCSTCPMFSASPAGSAALEDCHCTVGYVGPAGGPCEPCAVGKFGQKHSGRQAVCIDCPTGTSSASGAVQITDCTCMRGYAGEYDGASCNSCPAGSFKNFTGTGECSRCLSNSVTLPGAQSTDDCKCPPGYFGDVYGGDPVCVECAPGKYKTSLGSAACDSCPANSFSLAATTNLAGCQCNRGYQHNPGSVCAACPPGQYKNESGNFGCSAPQFENMSCGLYCRTTPYKATWQEAYTLDFTVDAVIECNSTCGDGSRAGLEECDDGNTESGDGCNSDCLFEDVVTDSSVSTNGTWECSLTPSNVTNSGEHLRGAVATCYRDVCQRTKLYNDTQSAKTTSQALTAVVSTVILFVFLKIALMLIKIMPCVLLTQYCLQAIVGVVAAGTGTALTSASGAAAFGADGGVHGSTGAGSASYSAGAGPVIAMINQVQMISMLGRAGGEKGFPSNKVFSNGFVWSNLDAATGDRAQDALRRKEQLSGVECDAAAGVHVLNKILVSIGVLIGIGLVREGARRLHARNFPAVTNPLDMSFPAWEGHAFVMLLVGISDAASKAIASGCLTWALFGTFALLLPVCAIVYAFFKIRVLVYQGSLVFVRHQAHKISQVRADLSPPTSKSLTSSAGWMVKFACALLNDRRFRGEWVKKTDEAAFWGFFVENTGGLWFCCGLLPALKLLVPAILNWTNGMLNVGMIVCILWGYGIISFFLHEHRDNAINLGGAFMHLGNALAVSFTAVAVFLPTDMVPIWINGPLALYFMLGSTILSVLIAIAEPSAQALAAISKNLSFVSTKDTARSVIAKDTASDSSSLGKTQAVETGVEILVSPGKWETISTETIEQHPYQLHKSSHDMPNLVDLRGEEPRASCAQPYTTPPERSNFNFVSVAPGQESTMIRTVHTKVQHYLEHLPGVVNVDSTAMEPVGLELLTPRPEINKLISTHIQGHQRDSHTCLEDFECRQPIKLTRPRTAQLREFDFNSVHIRDR